MNAVLGGLPLPGSNKPVSLPDLSFVFSQSSVVLADSNLAGPLSITASPKPVQVLSLDQILENARSERDVTYLEIQPAEISNDTVGLTLKAQIIPHDPAQRTLGLSSIRVKFRKVGDEWQIGEDPVFSAS